MLDDFFRDVIRVPHSFWSVAQFVWEDRSAQDPGASCSVSCAESVFPMPPEPTCASAKGRSLCLPLTFFGTSPPRLLARSETAVFDSTMIVPAILELRCSSSPSPHPPLNDLVLLLGIARERSFPHFKKTSFLPGNEQGFHHLFRPRNCTSL